MWTKYVVGGMINWIQGNKLAVKVFVPLSESRFCVSVYVGDVLSCIESAFAISSNVLASGLANPSLNA